MSDMCLVQVQVSEKGADMQRERMALIRTEKIRCANRCRRNPVSEGNKRVVKTSKYQKESTNQSERKQAVSPRV